jgi:hypothetical protein
MYQPRQGPAPAMADRMQHKETAQTGSDTSAQLGWRPALSLFPLELWVEIASHMQIKDLISIALASKATMIAASPFLERYRITHFTERAARYAAAVGLWNDQRLRLGIAPTEECESISCHGSKDGGKRPRGLYFQLVASGGIKDQEDCHRYIVCKACYMSGANGKAQGGKVILRGHVTLIRVHLIRGESRRIRR